jgi:hypothetical protein
MEPLVQRENMPILDDLEASNEAWKAGVSTPDFFVVSDMHNEYDRWHRVEASPCLVTMQLLNELIAVVQRWPGWCVYLALMQRGLTLLGNRILYEGELFDGASTVAELGERCCRCEGYPSSR